jgi:hypothetical protein
MVFEKVGRRVNEAVTMKITHALTPNGPGKYSVSDVTTGVEFVSGVTGAPDNLVCRCIWHLLILPQRHQESKSKDYLYSARFGALLLKSRLRLQAKFFCPGKSPEISRF